MTHTLEAYVYRCYVFSLVGCMKSKGTAEVSIFKTINKPSLVPVFPVIFRVGSNSSNHPTIRRNRCTSSIKHQTKHCLYFMATKNMHQGRKSILRSKLQDNTCLILKAKRLVKKLQAIPLHVARHQMLKVFFQVLPLGDATTASGRALRIR